MENQVTLVKILVLKFTHRVGEGGVTRGRYNQVYGGTGFGSGVTKCRGGYGEPVRYHHGSGGTGGCSGGVGGITGYDGVGGSGGGSGGGATIIGKPGGSGLCGAGGTKHVNGGGGCVKNRLVVKVLYVSKKIFFNNNKFNIFSFCYF